MVGLTLFPNQKKLTSEKNIDWVKQCVDAAEAIRFFDASRIRKTMASKKINYDLVNGIFNPKDLEKIFNPMELQGVIPATLQNYPIERPKFDLLVGEESKRKFDYMVRTVNEDAISAKEIEMNDLATEKIMKWVTDNSISDEVVKREVDRFQKYLKYDFQAKREVAGQRICDYFYKTQRMDITFNRCFYDVLVAAEQIVDIDIIAGEPVIRKVDPLALYSIRGGNSTILEDSDIIVEDILMPIGMAIDNYYEDMTAEDIDYLERGMGTIGKSSNLLNYNAVNPSFPAIGDSSAPSTNMSAGLISVDSNYTQYYGQYFDIEGNVRVMKTRWKSMRKIGFLTFLDENGQEQNSVVDENYKADKTKGEKIEWKWISEWWQCDRIADKIYVRYGPRKVQFREFSNISNCKPGYVGQFYNVNANRSQSLMDRIKPYKYLYNVFMYRFELAFSKYKGPILELDLSKKPDGWELDQWLHYAENMGFLVIDSFREAGKGAATGQLAGTMNTTGKVFNFEMGNYIQHHINALQYIEQKIADVSGVSAQREGQIENRETVGGVERSVTQSSHITEPYFMLNDAFKCRVMQTLIEVAKVAWSEKKSKRLQYMDDNLVSQIYDIDMDMVNETEYGIFVSNSNDDKVLRQQLIQLAQAGLQNDKMDMSTLMTILKNPSIQAITRDISDMEAMKKEEMAQAQQQQSQMAQQQSQAAQEMANAKEDREDVRTDKKIAAELQMKEMDIQMKEMELGIKQDESGKKSALEEAKMKLQESVKQLEEQSKDKQRQHDASEGEKERELKDKISSKKTITKK